MKVYFVGAGPGNPELLTVKATRLLAGADLVIYAGSLVNPEILRLVGSAATLLDSSSMSLPEINGAIQEVKDRVNMVVRLHSGDPSIFGAIGEQIAELDRLGISWEVVPGVSSFSASAAALGRELTVPGISQTVILTRLKGRTPVPESQNLAGLAAHRASLCLFLSMPMIDQAVAQLLAGYGPETPAAVVYKASWPEQQVIRGKLAEVPQLVHSAGISRTALLLVGDFINGGTIPSELYNPHFSHGYRQAAER